MCECDFEDLYNEDTITRLDHLHNETGDALQVVLRAKSFKPGVYEAEDYIYNWKLKKGKKRKWLNYH